MSFTALGLVEILLLFGLGGGLGLPLGLPPAPPDPLMVRVAPDDCLFFVTWAGMATPDPTSSNQTEQLLAEPEIQQFVAQLDLLIKANLAGAARDKDHGQLIADAARLVRVVLTHPVAVYLTDVQVRPGGPPDARGGILVSVGAAAAEIGARIKHYQDKFMPGAAKETEIAGSTVYQLQLGPDAPPISWGVKGKYIFATVGAGEVEALIKRAGTPPPHWLTGAAKVIAVPRPASLSYLNTKRIIELAAAQGGPKPRLIVDAIGLGNLTAVASITGLDKDGFVNRTLLHIEGQSEGLFAVLADQGLSPADLHPIPADATLAFAARIDTERILQTALDVAQRVGPTARAGVEGGLRAVEQQLGIDVREDLLQPLGETWCLYNSPSEGGVVITGATVVVQVNDHTRLAAAHAKLLDVARAAINRGDTGIRRARSGAKIEQFRFEDHDVYFLNSGSSRFPLAPSWCLTEKELIVATFPQNVKAYLSRGSDVASLATKPEVAAVFRGGVRPVKLAYQDTPRLFEMFYPIVPFVAQGAMSAMSREGIDVNIALLPSTSAIGKHLRPSVMIVRRTDLGIEVISRQTIPGGNLGAAVPLLTGLALPAAVSARGAAQRAQSMSNLKQIGLVMNMYHETHRSFPPAYLADENGKPLLSWRVAILPFIGESDLHKRFHLDEPWDSEHNKNLIARMPRAFISAGSRHSQPGMTNYLTVRGENTVFTGAKGTSLRELTDSSSKTIMVVEVNDQAAVPWTKPNDLAYDPQNPLQGLLGQRKGGFNAAFCDGHVRFIAESINPDVLRSLFIRNDGGQHDF